eukprot:TRINITY_DN2275_c0_g3_i1.p1 TRINITY_DN2275_c0_g3~~TRINITY_DN2275_c0_g3_i1.p1  ORF type:complete len:800 (-),score=143.67 TRINITY_DN2275_c0_g3_i1:259-2658(-)
MGAATGGECCASNVESKNELTLVESNPVPKRAYIDELPECPTQGVSLAFLQDFGHENRINVSDEDFTIGGLCVHIIKPFTKITTKSPYFPVREEVELLSYADVGFRTDLRDSRGCRAFHILAKHFVSHAWRYNFQIFLAALYNWVLQTGSDQDITYFWVDAFVVNQHAANDFPMEWWSTRFAQAVCDIGSTILISVPWQDPLPLKRVWVIWEILCTHQMGARFDIAMPDEAMSDFRMALINSFDTVQTALSKVDVGLSVAYHKSHQDMVHSEIERTIGFTKLNEMVSLRMNRWLIEAASRELILMKEQACKENWMERMQLQDNLARMLRESGNVVGAEVSFTELLAELEVKLGKDDVTALSCLNQLAVTLQKANRIDDALQRHRDCLERRRRILGEDHEDTLQSTSNLAVLLSTQRPLTVETFEEARTLYSRAVKGRETSIGADHPRTLYTLSNFAKFLSEAPKPTMELLEEAERAHERAASKLVEELSQGHPLSLAALHNQASCWLDRACFEGQGTLKGPLVEKALSQLRTVYKLRIEKLGKEHPDTELTERKLAEVSLRQMSSDSAALEGPSSWQDAFQLRFDQCNTAALFKQARAHLRTFGIEKVRDELVKTGFVDCDTGDLTTGFQPFNFFARIASNDQQQRIATHDQYLLGQLSVNYAIVHNKPECDDNWNSADPSWLGKASMSMRHRFLIPRNVHWEWFNVLTFGLISGPQTGVEMLEGMKHAALLWASQVGDWPDASRIGLFLVVWPLTTMPHAHLHIVDLDHVGLSFERLSKKMLPVDQAIEVLRAEIPQQ